MIETREKLATRLNTPEWDERLVIEPFLHDIGTWSKDVSPSVDFHLGSRFMVARRRPAFRHDPVSMDADDDIAPSEFFVAPGERVVLHPNQIVLGITLEWFRFPADLVAHATVRSIWGRRGLVVATATVVQPLSSGNITLELSTLGDMSVVLRPGEAIGQLFFETCGPVARLENGQDRPSRTSNFAATCRPSMGDYVLSDTESFYLGRGQKR